MSILDVPPVEMMSEGLSTSSQSDLGALEPAHDLLRTMIVETDSAGTSFTCKIKVYSIDVGQPSYLGNGTSMAEKATISLGNVPSRVMAAILLSEFSKMTVSLGFGNVVFVPHNMNNFSCSEEDRDLYSVVIDIRSAYFAKSKLDE